MVVSKVCLYSVSINCKADGLISARVSYSLKLFLVMSKKIVILENMKWQASNCT